MWWRMLFEVRQLYGRIIGGDPLSSTPLPTFPVAMELIDRETGLPLAGCMTGDDGSGDVTACFALAPGIQGMAGRDQVFLSLALRQDHPIKHLRLVLVPDPELWVPPSVPTLLRSSLIDDDAELEIGMQVLIHERYRTPFDTHGRWAFPHEAVPSNHPDFPNWIEFESVKRPGQATAYGFSAYVDFTVVAGEIQESELQLFIDRDGDGISDDVVTGIAPIGDDGDLDSNAKVWAEPNPGRGNVGVHWSNATLGARCRVRDVSGRIVASTTLPEATGATEIDLGGTSGVYFLEILTLKGTVIATGKTVVLD